MPRPTPSLRSIRTRGEARRVFVAQPSARVLAGAVAVPALARLGRRRFGVRDLAVATAVIAARGAHEWVIHRGLLHARPRTVLGVRLDPGAGHRAHHEDPDVAADALLKPADAWAFSLSVAAWIVLLCLPARARLGLRGTLTAVLAAEGCLLAYEWRHFVDHTSTPLRSRRAQTLRAHHRRHHHVDDTAAFGITTTSADHVHELVVRRLSAARR